MEGGLLLEATSGIPGPKQLPLCPQRPLGQAGGHGDVLPNSSLGERPQSTDMLQDMALAE